MSDYSQYKDLWKNNREKKRKPVTAKKFWCQGCDAQLVHEGAKCKNCGCKNFKQKRNKK